jgi:hypothetical protein
MKRTALSAGFACALALSAAVPSSAADGSERSKKIPFETEGTGRASKFERRIDAEKRAEEDALAKALRNTGVDIYYGFSDALAESEKRGMQMVSQYLWTFSRGAATWDPVGEPACEAKSDGSTECRVRLRGYIQLKGDPDPSFEIALAGSQGLSRATYRSGDPVEVSFRLSQESLVYVVSLDEEQNTCLLFPNRVLPDNRLPSGKAHVFPPKDSGISLVAYLPEGRTQTFEMLHIIATKVPLLTLDGLMEKEVGPYKVLSAGSLGDVMSKLARLPRDQWTMAVIPYEIRK